MNIVFVDGIVTVLGRLKVEQMYEVFDDDRMHDVWAETPDVIFWKGINQVVQDFCVKTMYVLPEARLRILGTFQCDQLEMIGIPDINEKTRFDFWKERAWTTAYNILMAFRPKKL